jgi:hypothetical protein
MKTTLTSALILCGFLAVTTLPRQSQQQTQLDPYAILQAQRNQTEQLAASWLHSSDVRLQAWGAYVVLRDDHRQFTPDLIAMVSAYDVSGWPVVFLKATPAQQDRHDAMLAILDAVIQLHASVHASEAARLYPEFPAQSLILLSRDGTDANSFLLEIFRAEHLQQAGWLAAGNLLVDRRVPGFAAAVLGAMTVHAKIRVVTTNTSGHGEGWAGDCGSDGPEDKPGWPAIGTYALLNCFSERTPDASLLAGGTDPAYYRRTVSALYKRVPRGCCGFSGPDAESPDLLREHYLTRMIYPPQESPPLKSSLSQTVVWKNGDAFLEYLSNFVHQQKTMLIDVARKLTAAGLMTSNEASTVETQIEITIVDERDDKSAPLPNPGNLGENVTLKM